MSQPVPLDPLPPGLRYDEQKGIVVEGVVARQLASHPLGPRPNRTGPTCTFNDLGGNTALTMFLADIEPGGTKCGHRHFDETMSYVVSGRGWSEFRQDPSAPLTRVDWQAGDLLAIPVNAWHEHFNAAADPPARFLSFKNAAVLRRLIGFGPLVDQSGWRARDRYDDQPDYFTTAASLVDGRITTGFLRRVGSAPLPAADPRLGTGVAAQRFVLGGQTVLDVRVLTIAPTGGTAPVRPLAETALLVLDGSGRTDLWARDREIRSVHWTAGDLVSPPLGVWRQHVNTGGSEVRCLEVRNLFFQRGLGVDIDTDGDLGVPDRFPDVVEAGEDVS